MRVQTGSRRCIPLLVVGALAASAWGADGPPAGWSHQDLDLRGPGGQRIKGIYFPPGSPPALRMNRGSAPEPKARRVPLSPEATSRSMKRSAAKGVRGAAAEATAPISALVIESPPIDGFVPYVAVSATDEHGSPEDYVAAPSSTVGPMLPTRQADCAIGLLDTGAGTFVMGYDVSVSLGVIGSYLTTSTITITGTTGSVEAWISNPIGMYVDGLSAIDASSGTLSTANMAGLINVAIAVGPAYVPPQPDLATAIGCPLPVHYASLFRNDQPLTRVVAGQTYEAPDISLHDVEDPALPQYPALVPLELRPLGAVNVQYIPYIPCDDPLGLGLCDLINIVPPTPSIIVGNSSQSLFFVSSVDLYRGSYSAIDRQRFMLDTGAQVTVIGKRVAARLALNLSHPEAWVPITGVDGQTIQAPLFHLSRIDIPALGEWLSFTNAPVIVLDVNSPEGGTLDGIIGMNLLTKYNFLIRGGGLYGGPDPSLECQVIAPLVIDVDFDHDTDVDMDDFAHIQACYAGSMKVQRTSACLNARLDIDSDVDDADVAIFIGCASGPGIPAESACRGG